MRVLAIVPAFNEEDSIEQVVAELRATSTTIDVLVVDDGSSDATARRARAAGARVARLPFNVGIGGAVQTGYRMAWTEGYDVACQVDGDGQHPADQLPRLLSGIEAGANYVVGSRFVEQTDYRPSRSRRGGMLVLSWVVSRIVGKPVTDTTSGFRAADKEAIRLFAGHYPHDYPEVEALVMAARDGLTVAEVSVDMRDRTAGRSSITPLRSVYYMCKVLLAVGVQCLGRRPARQELGT